MGDVPRVHRVRLAPSFPPVSLEAGSRICRTSSLVITAPATGSRGRAALQTTSRNRLMLAPASPRSTARLASWTQQYLSRTLLTHGLYSVAVPLGHRSNCSIAARSRARTTSSFENRDARASQPRLVISCVDRVLIRFQCHALNRLHDGCGTLLDRADRDGKRREYDFRHWTAPSPPSAILPTSPPSL